MNKKRQLFKTVVVKKDFNPFVANERLSYEELSRGIRVWNDYDVAEIPQVLVNRSGLMKPYQYFRVGSEVERANVLEAAYKAKLQKRQSRISSPDLVGSDWL